MGAQLGEGLRPIQGVACLHLLDALTERLMKALPVLGVQLGTHRGEHLVDQDDLYDLALGQVGRFVENQAAMANVSAEGLQRLQV
jgi:hypothetical protein